MMFGERCYGMPGCGHSTNWTCPCTCDEEMARDTTPLPVATAVPAVAQAPSEVDLLKARIEGMALYVTHDAGCEANDLDYLDRTPCTCGLRRYHNPKGLDDERLHALNAGEE
jgi:hypothetical protein